MMTFEEDLPTEIIPVEDGQLYFDFWYDNE